MSDIKLSKLINSLSEGTTTKLASGYYNQGLSRGIIDINMFFNQIIESLGNTLESSSTSLGRIDLPSGNVISLDFVLSGKSEGEDTKGVCLGTTKDGGGISYGVWGNKWVISMSALTMNGERNLIQTFSITQPMLSRYDQHCSTDSVEKKHTDLVEAHLNQGAKAMTGFLTHYLNRIKS